jgi:peptidoglycan/xylan/chitin deacetylase (PgdA/CDA1 family)
MALRALKVGDFAMRLAAMVCALAIVVCVAVFGVIRSQRSSVPIGSTSPEQTASAEGPVRSVVTTVEEQSAPLVETTGLKPAPSSDVTSNAPTGIAQGSPAVAAATAPASAQVPTAAAPPAASAQAPAAVARAGSSCPGNPDALGISRVVEIDTTGGPGFGFEHFKTHDFLREGEVVLTFDDGPWPKNTQAVLAALAANCTKAIFFPIGLHATYEPAILKQVAAAGHAIGSHTWCHQDLSKTKGTCLVNGKRESVEYDPKDEIEKGISAVHWAVGGPTAPYFRFPALKQPPELIEYLGKRNIGIFSTDIDSFDFKMRKPEQVIKSVMTKLEKRGKGIILMHDFQHATAEAIPELIRQFKAAAYKVVHMVPRQSLITLPKYDEMVIQQDKYTVTNARPENSVVRTITE